MWCDVYILHLTKKFTEFLMIVFTYSFYLSQLLAIYQEHITSNEKKLMFKYVAKHNKVLLNYSSYLTNKNYL